MAKEVYKNKTDKELLSELYGKKNSLRDFYFKISKGKVKNVKDGYVLRKQIARILTEINNRKNKK